MNRHNRTVSVQLTKAQRKLRYLAGHENMSDKNVLIKLPRISHNDDDDTVNETAAIILSDPEEEEPPSYNVARDKKVAAVDTQTEELSDPPSYQYPKHLLADQTTEQ